MSGFSGDYEYEEDDSSGDYYEDEMSGEEEYYYDDEESGKISVFIFIFCAFKSNWRPVLLKYPSASEEFTRIIQPKYFILERSWLIQEKIT